MKFNELTTLKDTYLNKKFEGYSILIENNQWIAKKPLVEGIMDEVVHIEVKNVISRFKDIKGDLQEMQDTFNHLENFSAIGFIEDYDKQEFIENCMLKVLIFYYCEHNNLPLLI